MEHKLLWKPDEHTLKQSQMYEFLQLASNKFELTTRDYPTLHRWSVEYPEQFWGLFWDYAGIVHSQKAAWVVDNPDMMPGAKWFGDARLNFAENLLRHRGEKTAIIFRGEDGAERRLTQQELYLEVARIAEGLKRQGVGVGDRVAGFMPNIPETVIAMLAAASLGAIWSSSSPDFGIKGVLDRFSQIEPKVIFSADGYHYNGKQFDSQQKLCGILQSLPSVIKVVLVNFTGNRVVETIPNAVPWESFGAPPHTKNGVCAIAFQPPAVYHVLVRNYGAAQKHCALSRRHADPAPQGTEAALRPQT